MSDSVNHPSHYTAYDIEVIELTRRLNFDAGNCVKYILRAPFKGKTYEDLCKAMWYADDIVHNGKKSSRMFLKAKAYDKLYKKVHYFENRIMASDIPCPDLFCDLYKAVFDASIAAYNTPCSTFKSAVLEINSILTEIFNDEEWNEYRMKQAPQVSKVEILTTEEQPELTTKSE